MPDPRRTRDQLENMPRDVLDGLRTNARRGPPCQSPFFAGEPRLFTLTTTKRCPHPSRFGLWMRVDDALAPVEPHATMCGTHRNALERRAAGDAYEIRPL